MRILTAEHEDDLPFDSLPRCLAIVTHAYGVFGVQRMRTAVSSRSRLSWFEVRWLRALVVGECGPITLTDTTALRIARFLNCSVATVSQQLLLLEDRIGGMAWQLRSINLDCRCVWLR